jgi:hypothetical protein
MKTLIFALSFVFSMSLAHAGPTPVNPIEGKKLTTEQMIQKVSGEYKLVPDDDFRKNHCGRVSLDGTYQFTSEIPLFIQENLTARQSDPTKTYNNMIFLEKYTGTDERFIKDYGYWLPVYDRPLFSSLNIGTLKDSTVGVNIENTANIYETRGSSDIVMSQQLLMSNQDGASIAIQLVTFSPSGEYLITTHADGSKTQSFVPMMYAKYQYIIVGYGPTNLIEEIMNVDECLFKRVEK